MKSRVLLVSLLFLAVVLSLGGVQADSPIPGCEDKDEDEVLVNYTGNGPEECNPTIINNKYSSFSPGPDCDDQDGNVGKPPSVVVGVDTSTNPFTYEKERVCDFDGDGEITYGSVDSTYSRGEETKGGKVIDCNEGDFLIDDPLPWMNSSSVWYYDGDGDGFYKNKSDGCPGGQGGTNWFINRSSGPKTTIIEGKDCDDDDGDITSANDGTCDGDGDGEIDSTSIKPYSNYGYGDLTNGGKILDCDDDDPLQTSDTTWYQDSDGDGYYDTSTSYQDQCAEPQGTDWYLNDSSHSQGIKIKGNEGSNVCNAPDAENNESINPDATELCNPVDMDCDGNKLPSGTDYDITNSTTGDYCVDSGILKEVGYCNTTSWEMNQQGKSVICSEEQGPNSFCHEGACMQCKDSDSDASDVYTVSGEAININGTKSDSCMNNTHLVEYSCSGASIDNETLDCTSKGSGYSCSEGACQCDPDWSLTNNPGCSADDFGEYSDSKCASNVQYKEDHCDYKNKGLIGDQNKFDKIMVDGEELDGSQNFTGDGSKNVTIMKNDRKAVSFTWNFGSDLNFYEVNVSSDDDSDGGYTIANSNEDISSKTLYVPRSVESSNQVCVKDQKGVSSAGNISDGCNASGEVLLDCPSSGPNSSYNCEAVQSGEDEDSEVLYKVWPLEHSGVKEVEGDNLGGGSGGEACTEEDYDCSPWKNTCSESIGNTRNRNCTKVDPLCDEDLGISKADVEQESCGSGGDPVNGSQQCTESDWKCETSDWSKVDCEDGEKERTCTKLGDCSGGYQPNRTKSCQSGGSGENEFPWLIVGIAVGVLLVALAVLFVVWKMYYDGDSSSSKKSSRSRSSSSSNRVYRPRGKSKPARVSASRSSRRSSSSTSSKASKRSSSKRTSRKRPSQRYGRA